MATIDTNNALTGASTPGFLSRLIADIRDWNDARVTRRALSQLSARELDDIGLCRGDIDTIIARRARR
jgi:uncharacterized protein YjiS (DUF1127 family)